ncbi:DUF4350 domain-containing protein [Phycicoccus sp. SLBN-51]|uniref:DUF4350 domain-containing protein n=1 Tax=Phycicoccus sp. SLBN-51 TaxID=2768447 RepID=UPI001150FFAB|nr:DUF4350 domain-containing protein [Phycicoccus sp. SLBN-51]TQJ51831.1 hypothetical protein FBY26_3569 [Phycicoccus sp. SLBN-51]
MSLTVWDRHEAEATTPTDGSPGGTPEAPHNGRSRRRRLVLVTAVVLVLALVVAVAVSLARRGGNDAPLDPRNPGANGAQAVVRVLEQRGVAVDIARGQTELEDTDAIDGSTTVLVSDPRALSEETAAAMWDKARGARRLVLVEPDRFLLEALDLDVSPAGGGSPTRSLRAGCVLPGLTASDTVTAGGTGYSSLAPGATRCFTFEGTSELVSLPTGPGTPEVVVLGSGDLLSNGEVTRYDNAGVSLRLLGQGDRLVWYVPSVLDVSAGDTTPSSELPRALGPLALLALFAVLALMLWRGRRFGPLVTEPLPAVVKAVETTQSRGRLYRRARDTGRAGTVLRAAATRRLASWLGLPVGATPEAVAQATAAASGRPLHEVLALLAGPPPADEDAMVALADDLSTLEKEVHRP